MAPTSATVRVLIVPESVKTLNELTRAMQCVADIAESQPWISEAGEAIEALRKVHDGLRLLPEQYWRDMIDWDDDE